MDDTDNLFDTTMTRPIRDLLIAVGPDVMLAGDIRRRIRGASPEDLDELRRLCLDQGAFSILDLVDSEQSRRDESAKYDMVIGRLVVLEKPHWTTTPGFWLTAAGFALAVWLGWLSSRQPHPADGSGPQNSLSTPLSTPQPQTKANNE